MEVGFWALTFTCNEPNCRSFTSVDFLTRLNLRFYKIGAGVAHPLRIVISKKVTQVLPLGFCDDGRGGDVCGLTFELSGRQRQDALDSKRKMGRRPSA